MIEQITVLSAIDHPLLREGLATVINAQPDMCLVAQASTGREAIEAFRRQQAEITLIDLTLPDMSGIEAMIAIRAEFPHARFVFWATLARHNEIGRALAEGAQGCMLENMRPIELVDAIRRVHGGKKSIPMEIATLLAEHFGDEPLTSREVEVLRQLLDGNRNRDIAEKLFITEETVKAHMKRIIGKLRANDRTQALTIALRLGVIHL